FGLLAVFFTFVPLGWWRGSYEQMQPLFKEGYDLSGVLLSTLAVVPIVTYCLMGFETVPKCAEEAATGFQTRRFAPVMLLALAAGTLFYVAVIATVAMLYPWQELSKKDFATAIAFEHAFGSKALVWLLILGATLSLLKVFNGMFLASTRLLYAMGRRGLVGAGVGTVDARYQTPTVAIVLVCAITLLATFLGRAVLGPISEVGSLAGALGWLAACLALSFGAGGQVTRGERALGLCGAAVSLALAGGTGPGFKGDQWLAPAAGAAPGVLLWTTPPARTAPQGPQARATGRVTSGDQTT